MITRTFIATLLLVATFVAGAQPGNAASMPVKSLENSATLSVLKHKLQRMREDRAQGLLNKSANRGGSCDLDIGEDSGQIRSLLLGNREKTIIILGSVIKLDGGSARCTDF